jgi:hypothetical protein
MLTEPQPLFFWKILIMEAELDWPDCAFVVGVNNNDDSRQEFSVVRAALLFGIVPSECEPLELMPW